MKKNLTTCRDISACLGGFNTFIGRSLAWLTLAMVLVTSGIVLCRQLFDLNSVAAQESLTYMHALVLMAASAYTLREQGHVRVDIFYRQYSLCQKAWIDLLGSLVFLLPLAIFSCVISWGFVAQSWVTLESSSDAGGIPAVFILKSFMFINGVLLAIQALSDIAKHTHTIIYTGDDPNG